MLTTAKIGPDHITADVGNNVPAEDDGHPVSVLGKVHLLLAAFTSGATTLGLTELSRRSGVPKATAHRLGTELVQLGFLARTSKGYQLGWRMFELGQLVPGPASLRTVARPALQDLRMMTKSVVHLAVPHGLDCVYLERLAGRRERGIVAAVGTRVSSWLTASGRIFLAYSDQQSLSSLGKEALDALGVRHHAELGELFARIRQRRYADEHQQCLHGFKTISVPLLYNGTDHAIAAISATLLVDRRDDQQVVHALWETAADISRGLQRSVDALRSDQHLRPQLVG